MSPTARYITPGGMAGPASGTTPHNPERMQSPGVLAWARREIRFIPLIYPSFPNSP